jgi:hypothetical protein
LDTKLIGQRGVGTEVIVERDLNICMATYKSDSSTCKLWLYRTPNPARTGNSARKGTRTEWTEIPSALGQSFCAFKDYTGRTKPETLTLSTVSGF